MISREDWVALGLFIEWHESFANGHFDVFFIHSHKVCAKSENRFICILGIFPTNAEAAAVLVTLTLAT